MSERLREAARAVLDECEGVLGLRVSDSVTELRAALDAEPEPTPSEEDRALELAREAFRHPKVTVELFAEWFAAALATARAEGYAEGAEAMRSAACSALRGNAE